MRTLFSIRARARGDSRLLTSLARHPRDECRERINFETDTGGLLDFNVSMSDRVAIGKRKSLGDDQSARRFLGPSRCSPERAATDKIFDVIAS